MTADQTKLRKRLEVLLKLPENQVCADCKKRGPRWASANLGIFICIECSGIHRNLGVHISFVRSVNLDSWTKAQVDFMEEWGNGRANEYYEANVPSHVSKPKEGDSVRVVEKYIRDKYEHKKYIAKNVPPKIERSSSGDEEETPSRRKKPVAGLPAPVVTRPRPTGSSTKTQPVVPVTKAAEPAQSFIDFMDMDAVPTTSAPACAPSDPSHFGAFGQTDFVDFGPAPSENIDNFMSTPAAVPSSTFVPSTSSDQSALLSVFTAPIAPSTPILNPTSALTPEPAPAPAPVSAVTVAPAKPQASTAAILSLYGSAPTCVPGVVNSMNILQAPQGPQIGGRDPGVTGTGLTVPPTPVQQPPMIGVYGNGMQPQSMMYTATMPAAPMANGFVPTVSNAIPGVMGGGMYSQPMMPQVGMYSQAAALGGQGVGIGMGPGMQQMVGGPMAINSSMGMGTSMGMGMGAMQTQQYYAAGQQPPMGMGMGMGAVSNGLAGQPMQSQYGYGMR